MTRVRVKICGITRPEDAVSAAALGADAVGLVFYAQSPRHIQVDQAGDIVKALPPFVARVGLFVDPGEELVSTVLDKIPLDLLQFHGGESPEMCRQFSKPYIKAVRMSEGVELTRFAELYHDASALLLDTHVESLVGGTGQTFDWKRVPKGLKLPVILAGGLTAENVAAAIYQTRPYAVDVSGGVESRQGIKDHEKIRAFINAVNNA